MPKNRKYFPHKSVLLLTARTEEGLPMPPNHVMNHLIWGILAEARRKYHIRICHFVFMANHMHLIVVVQDPEAVSAFMRYVKAELAHAINRLLGRPQKTIWQEGYDSPRLLTPDRVINYISYIYLNPVRAGLVEKIEDYPGVSSWQLFNSGSSSCSHARVPRDRISKLDSPHLSVAEQRDIVLRWELKASKPTAFVVEPWAWLDAFAGLDRKEIHKQIHSDIRQQTKLIAEERSRQGLRVVGVKTLRRQSMTKAHRPKKRSRRMVALCEDKQYRKEFLGFYRALVEQARNAYQAWKLGELEVRVPPGMFAPKVPVLAVALQL